MKKILFFISFLTFSCTNTNIPEQEEILQIDHSQARDLISLSIDCVDKKFPYKIGYRFIFQSYHSTIKDTEVEKIMNTIIAESTSIETVKIPGIG